MAFELARSMAAAVLAVAAALAFPAWAEVVEVAPGDLPRALSEAGKGDELRLAPGRHEGGITITTPLTLSGAPGSVIDGGGEGRVITVDAPGATVRGLEIVNSGISLADEDAGIFVTEAAKGAVIAENTLKHNLIGVYLKGPENAVVRDNRIVGRKDLRMNERGNGVHVWNAPGSEVIGNDIRHGRDGIFVTTSKDNRFTRNRFRDLRFGVHYMYTQASEVSDNRSQGNHAGYALMFSRHLDVRGNRSTDDRDHGILLNYVNYSDIAGNAVVDGGNKCVFIYNSNINSFHRNWFEGCEIGIHFTAGSERNEISDNAFIDNRRQVKYVGTRHLDWSAKGRGNFWSDNPAFDLDGDGMADRPYRPNDLVDSVVWAHSQAKLLLNSPAVQILRFAQSQFPAVNPGGVVDSAPLMRPPSPNALTGEANPE